VLANATSVLAAVGDGAGDGVSVGGNGVGGSAAHVNYDIEALYKKSELYEQIGRLPKLKGEVCCFAYSDVA
jgi:hypothetical protein